MKRIVKTLEELRATEGVVEQNGVLIFGDSEICFPISEMYQLCGTVVYGELNKCGGILLDGFTLTPWMWKEVEDNPAEGLEFPCKMIVWDSNADSTSEMTVIAYIPELLFPWLVLPNPETAPIGYMNAKPIPKFKPRYVWVKRYQHSDYELAKEAFSDKYYFFGDDAEYKSLDFVEIKDAEVK